MHESILNHHLATAMATGLAATYAASGVAAPHNAPLGERGMPELAPVLPLLLQAAGDAGQMPSARSGLNGQGHSELKGPARSTVPAGARCVASPADRGLRRKLFDRVARSAAASRTLHTQRVADTTPVHPELGVTLRPLYRATGTRGTPGMHSTHGTHGTPGTPGTRLTRPLRPGEPEAVTLVELAPGTTWSGPDASSQRAWLVLAGSVNIGGEELQAHDYHVLPAGLQAGALHSAGGALLYQREAPMSPEAHVAQVAQVAPEFGALAVPTQSPPMPFTQRAAQAHWEEFGPGIHRRLMWQHQGLAAMLYHALPGAAVPHHGHGHDEECLMLAGDFFLDDVLLRPLDYQVAPAGTEHVAASTDTGILVFAHGDVALDVKG